MKLERHNPFNPSRNARNPPVSSASPSSSTAITNAVETPATLSNPEFGVSSVNVTPATSQTPSTSQTPATTQTTSSNPDFSSSTALQPPSTVTPPALSSVSSASSVTSPNSSIPSLPGDASSVTPPGSSVPPTSSTPSSSGVTPPSSSPGTASGVTPPGSSGGTVTPQNFRVNGGPCIQSWVFGSVNDTDCHDWDVDALQRKADALKEEIKNSTGRSPQERASLEFDLAKVQAERLDLTHPNTGGASGKASIEAMQQAPAYQKMTPVEKLAYWKVLNYGMESGKVGAKDLANTASAMWGIGQNKNVLALYPELSGKGLPTGIGSPGGFNTSLAMFGFAFAGTAGGGLTLGITTTVGGLACPVCVAALAIAGDALVVGLAAGGAFLVGKEIAKGIQSVFKSSGVSPGILKSEPVTVPTIPATPGTSPGPDWVWNGRPGSVPGGKEGSWVNPGTGETLRPDLDHPAPIEPHWDYKDPDGKWWRIYPDGRKEPK